MEDLVKFLVIIFCLVAFVFGVGVMYAIFAFVIWEINPSLWDTGARMFLAYFGLIAGVAMAIGLFHFITKPKKR